MHGDARALPVALILLCSLVNVACLLIAACTAPASLLVALLGLADLVALLPAGLRGHGSSFRRSSAGRLGRPRGEDGLCGRAQLGHA